MHPVLIQQLAAARPAVATPIKTPVKPRKESDVRGLCRGRLNDPDIPPGLMFAPYDALRSADSSSMAATAAAPALRSQ